jgi:hypothetical protein
MAWSLGAAGLVAYNWWVLAVLPAGVVRSPDVLFSNLEVTGRPYSSAMQLADVLAGLALLAAFLVAGSRNTRAGRAEWAAMLAFCLFGGVGGLVHQACADGTSAACRSGELHLQLPVSQYVHDGAGIAEFAAITFALVLALHRTRSEWTLLARVYRGLARGALVAYPALFLAYLTGRLGAVAEAAFFAGFSVMVIAQLAELTPSRDSRVPRIVPFPAAPRGTRSAHLLAGPVDDAGPERVADRNGEHVHQPGERPNRQQPERQHRVHLEGPRRTGHCRGARVEHRHVHAAGRNAAAR